MNFLLLVSTCLAHYKLTSPQSRGSDDLMELTQPCGGYEAGNPVVTSLQTKVTILSGHVAQISYYISKSKNPKTQQDFVMIAENVTVASVGPFSYDIDFSKPPASLVANDTAVLQTIFDGPDGSLFQCADMVMTAASTSNSASSLGPSITSILGFAILALF